MEDANAAVDEVQSAQQMAMQFLHDVHHCYDLAHHVHCSAATSYSLSEARELNSMETIITDG